MAFVASGKADGGVLNASVMDKLLEKGDANAKRVKIIATTPPYFDYNWTVRPELDPALTKKLTDAFLKLDAANPAHKELMDKYATFEQATYNHLIKKKADCLPLPDSYSFNYTDNIVIATHFAIKILFFKNLYRLAKALS